MRVGTALAAAAIAASCAAPPDREIDVGMLEYGFLPARIEVAAAERVRLTIRNIGRLEHDFATDERGKALGLGHVHLRAGASGALDWTAPATPTVLRVTCTIAGHEQLGMTATLVVAPRASPSPPP